MKIGPQPFKLEEAGDSILGGAPAAASAEPVVEPDGGAEPLGTIEEGWLKGVDREFADDPSLQAVQDLPTLVKNYVNAQRMVGKKGYILPDQNADGDKWRELYTQLGGPGKEDYKYDLPENNQLDDEFLSKLNEVAYNNNMLPNQTKALVDFYLESLEHEQTQFQEQQKEALTESIDVLKNEWGEGFDKKVRSAQTVIEVFGDTDLREYFDTSGLGNDPNLIKFLSKVGENLSEDNFEQEAVGHLGITPDEAQEEINMTLSASDHPYNNGTHANHKKAVERMTKLFGVLNR